MKSNGFYTLGIEGGGTKTTWALVADDGTLYREGKAGPGNVQLMTPEQLASLFHDIDAQLGRDAILVKAVGGAFAGCQLASEKRAVEVEFRRIWPHAASFVAGEDTRSAFAAAHGTGDGLIVIAGTGSNVQGRKGARWEKAGGWGELFADPGSGWDIARRGLEAVYTRFDETGKVGELGRAYLRATGFNTLPEMVPHLMAQKGKTYLASLAPCVFASARKGDPDARRLCVERSAALADRVLYVAKRLGLKKPNIGMIGSLLEKDAKYRALFEKAVRARIAAGKIFFIETPGSVGAARMVTDFPSGKPLAVAHLPEPKPAVPYASSPTEGRNPRSRHLDKKSVAKLVDLFVSEESYVQAALKKARPQLAAAAGAAAKAIGSGHRLFYLGSGTSGRLGVLDASEMPPTFNVPPDLVQGIIAGGAPALLAAQEGAEDDFAGGAAVVAQCGAERGDVVVGITASGSAPFVRGALEEALRRKATVFLLTCNPHHHKIPGVKAVVLETGPEIISGSTRLKAGTVTKLALNLISSISMIRSGRVKDNLMVNVQPTNAKLRDRAKRLVMTLTGDGEDAALQRLAKAKWDVAKAVR